MFSGVELDQETGLYSFGVRTYDPRAQQWISADRYLELAWYSVEPELLESYSYAFNNPVMFSDASGFVPNPEPETANGVTYFNFEVGEDVHGRVIESAPSDRRGSGSGFTDEARRTFGRIGDRVFGELVGVVPGATYFFDRAPFGNQQDFGIGVLQGTAVGFAIDAFNIGVGTGMIGGGGTLAAGGGAACLSGIGCSVGAPAAGSGAAIAAGGALEVGVGTVGVAGHTYNLVAGVRILMMANAGDEGGGGGGSARPALAPRDEARRRGRALLEEMKSSGVGTASGRSGGHGTPHQRAGAQLVREGNTFPRSDPRREAYRIEGQRLINQGRSHNHR